MSEEIMPEQKIGVGQNSRPERGVKTFVTASARATEELGMRLADGLSAGSVIALCGELGAGKTVLARGIARGLGVEGYLKSPSFTIVNEYNEGRVPLYHIDLYRLPEGTAGGDAEELGLEEYLYGDGVCVIEWAERAVSLIPDDAIRVTITYGGELQDEGVSEASDLGRKELPEGSEDPEEDGEEVGTDDETRTLLVSFNEYEELAT